MKNKCNALLMTLAIMMLVNANTLFAQNTYMVEAEDFQFTGGWGIKGAKNQALGDNYLAVLSGAVTAADALTVINIQKEGIYFVWSRTRDYPEASPGTRLFKVYINQEPMPEESGKHGKDGYHWEKVGEALMPAGHNVISLKDTKANYARCDAVLLSSDKGFDPEKISMEAIMQYKVKPVAIKATKDSQQAMTQALTVSNQPNILQEIRNEKIRLRFMEAAGSKTIISKTEVWSNNEWLSVDAHTEDHQIGIVYAADPMITFSSFYPSWNNSLARSHFTVNGKQYETIEGEDAKNPYLAGQLEIGTIQSVTKLSNNKIKVVYATKDIGNIDAEWSLTSGANHLTLNLRYIPSKDGYYSLLVNAFQAVDKTKLVNVELAPMFQYQRVPKEPMLLPGAIVTQPVAMVESKGIKSSLTAFVAASMSMFPLEWNTADSSRVGFSLKNASNKVQATAFSPVLGLKTSKFKSGNVLERNFEIGLLAGPWDTAMEYVSNNVFHVKDYRSQKTASLTDAAFNMVDLISNDSASGYDKELKGFYDIEANPRFTPTVAQVAPLAIVASAVIEHNEDFYIQRALPAIEYSLSRNGFRSAKAFTGDNFKAQIVTLEYSPYSSQYGTPYFEGLHKLLGAANPWLATLAMPNGRPRKVRASPTTNLSNYLAAYRLTNNKLWLDSATASAKIFVREEINGKKTSPLGIDPFYNVTFYPNWWYLMDIYDVTGDKEFLDAASTAAFHTIAGVRSFPEVQDKLQTIHAGNKYGMENPHIWWRGKENYRLGYPRKKNDVLEKQVPQSIVSPVGLGFEQPFTLFRTSGPIHNVYMSSWAPHLLKLYAYNKRKIFETYARNAVIGRFTNYPGYYATGFTNLQEAVDYPVKGPDVTGIYYHHIAPHLSFTWDYLITSAIQRSNGKINFPYGKQEGFVWFNNRVYGAEKGTIMNDSNVQLWMKKGLIKIDQPSVNYITGISDNRFWMVLMNEESAIVKTTIVLSNETKVAKGTTATVFADGSKISKGQSIKLKENILTLSLPARGTSIVSLPLASTNKVQQLPPVKNGMQVIELGQSLGRLYAFRIRSPFGWDSFYGYLSNGPIEGLEASASLKNESPTIKKGYPYEWSFYHVSPSEKMEVEIIIKQAGIDGEKKVIVLFEGNQ